MAYTKFPVEILTPEGLVYEGEVEMVSTRTTTGSIGILANHEPLLAILDPTELRLYESDSEIVRFAQAEGYIQVAEGRALMLVEEAVRPPDLDAAALREKISRAESEIAAAEEGSEARAAAERNRERAEAFLEIAQGGD